MIRLNYIGIQQKTTYTKWQHAVMVVLAVFLFSAYSSRLQAQNLTISSGGNTGTSGTNWSTSGTNPVTISASGDANINTSVVVDYLNAGISVILVAPADIRLSNAISKTAGTASLTFQAGRDIFIQAGISSAGSSLPLTFNADSNDDNLGAIAVTYNLNTNGGAVTFEDDITFNGVAAQAINSDAAAIAFNGEVMLSNTSGVTLTASDYDITFTKAVNSGNSFALDATARTWNDAYTAHSSTNSYLATITSRVELAAAMAVVPSGGAWLGGSDQETEGTWKWVTGPEAGTIFWTTALSQGIKGYVGTNGSFVNWNTGEPNNSSDNEDALQIRNNTDGFWNDLPATISTLASVVETQLSPSPLTINAGTGTVTFSGAVGASNPLKTLTVTAATTAINGGSVITNADGTHGGSGTQSYSGNITLGSASTTLSMLDTPTDFTLNSGKTITNQSGGDAALTIKTTAGIITGANSIISSSTGKLNTILWADTDANGGGIFVNAGASITSNGGDVTLSGGTDYTTGYARGTSATVWSGVRIDGSINSGAGSVLLRGEMGDIPNGQNTLSPGGVFIVPSGSITATSGNITLAGYVSSNVGTGNALRAIRLGDGIASVGQASITTTSGNISLTGTTAPTYAGAGILFDSSKIQSGSGSITLTGQRGGGEPDLLFNSGTTSKNISNQISSTTGNITMNANSLEVWGEGDLYTRLPISSAGQLTIQPRTAGTTIGLGGGAGSLSLAADLVTKSFKNGFSSVTIGHSTAGNITVGGALSYNDPLTLKTPGDIVVNANASISGTTSQNAHLVLWADADGNNGGVIIVNSGSSIATNGGHFWMGGGSGSTTWNGLTVGDGYATGVDATGVRDGVLINNATINTSGGDIALYGKSAVSANIEAGIRLNDHLSGSASTVVNSGAGKILLDGIGRGSAGFAGVEFNTTNTAATVRITSTNTTAEAITINGDSQAATASGWGLLFYFGTEISATGAGGGITIIGKINNLGGKAIGFHSPGQTGTRVLANGGPIIFNAITNGTGNSIYAVGNNMVVGQLAGSTVPTSSSNITLNIDRPMTGTSTNVPDLTFSSSGSLAIQPLTANTTIGIGGATGTVPLPASLFTTSFADGFSQITIGGSTQSGNINLNSVTFRDNMHLQTTGTVGVNAGQTITATGIKLQIDNTLGMGAGSSLIR